MVVLKEREDGGADCCAVCEGVSLGGWEYGEDGERGALGVYHFIMSGFPLNMELCFAA